MHYYWFTYATTHTYIQYVAIAAIMRSTWLADLALALRDKLVNILMAFFCEDLVHECGFDDWMSRIVLIVDRSGKIVPVLTNESQESRLAMPRARLFASLRLLLLVATLCVRLTEGQAQPLCSAGLGWRQRLRTIGSRRVLGGWCGVDEAVMRI
jgi:hypothetical protein